jgi:hypothetical protein
MPAGFAAALLITVIGVLYFGIFSNQVIQKFSQPINIEARASAEK